jgi:hypothetical protein
MFPWTEAKLESARELVDMMEKLSPKEREQLKATLADLTVDNPGTELAAAKFKLLAAKAGGDGYSILKQVVTGVATEAAKRAMFPGP